MIRSSKKKQSRIYELLSVDRNVISLRSRSWWFSLLWWIWTRSLTPWFCHLFCFAPDGCSLNPDDCYEPERHLCLSVCLRTNLMPRAMLQLTCPIYKFRFRRRRIERFEFPKFSPKLIFSWDGNRLPRRHYRRKKTQPVYIILLIYETGRACN